MENSGDSKPAGELKNGQTGKRFWVPAGSVIIPGRIIEDGSWFRLTPAAKDVYMVLRRYCNQMGVTQCTLPGLRTKAHVKTRQTLYLALVELVEKGLILKRVKMGDTARDMIRSNAPKNTWMFWTDPLK